MKKMSKNILLVFVGIVISFVTNVAAEAVISSGAVSYSNTTVSAALDELFSAVDINNKIGTTDISGIGSGTITDAISTNYNNILQLNNNLVGFNINVPDAIASSNITINKAYLQKIGNLGLVRINFSTTSTIPKYTQIFKNIGLQIKIIGITSDYFCHDISRTHQFEFDATGYIQTLTEIPSGAFVDIAVII